MFTLIGMLVQSEARTTGVNAFLYHTVRPTPETPAGLINLQAAVEAPGNLQAWSTSIPPGGNNVLAVLEVVLRDQEIQELAFVVGALEKKLKAENSTPLGLEFARCAARINVSLGVESAPEKIRILRLISPVVSELLSRQPMPDPGPIMIRVRLGNGEARFTVDQSSLGRIASARGGPQAAPSLSITFDTLGDFEQALGGFLPHVATTITGMSDEQLLEAGGVRFVSEDGRSITGEYLTRAAQELGED